MIYIVQPGDTLNGISIRLLGSATPAATLFQINKSRIRSGSPLTLAAGEQLVIPDQMIEAGRSRKRAAEDINEVTLLVNGLEYAGWESARISRSMETAAATFSVQVTDKWQPGEEPWPIFCFDEVRVYVGSDLLITGYVDDVTFTIDDAAHAMTVSGRDRTADLVDCSTMNRPGTFKNKKLEEISTILALPFGVEVVASEDTGAAIPNFTLLPGEKVYEAISRAAIAKNFLVTSSPSGNLLITRSGSIRAKDAIVEGQNLLSGQSRASGTERFSDYVVEGQSSGQGQAKNGMKASYHDAGVPRYRPMMIHAEQKATADSLKARAQWEARSRASKSTGATVSLVGLRQSSGALWEPNRLVAVHSPSLGLDEDLLIGAVTYDISPSGGRISDLSLVRPDAYTSEEELRAEKDTVRQRRLNRRGSSSSRKVTQAEIDAENRANEGLLK